MRKAGDVSRALEDCDIVNKGITVCARVYEDYEYVVTLTDGTTTDPNVIMGTTTNPIPDASEARARNVSNL